MEKIVMAIRVTPKTLEKIRQMKDISGLAYGCLIDKLVMEYPICSLNQACETDEVIENNDVIGSSSHSNSSETTDAILAIHDSGQAEKFYGLENNG